MSYIPITPGFGLANCLSNAPRAISEKSAIVHSSGANFLQGLPVQTVEINLLVALLYLFVNTLHHAAIEPLNDRLTAEWLRSTTPS